MGFMDKAKKLAEQAQEKLDDAQKQFNQDQSGGDQQAGGEQVRYDEHGRPIPQDSTPAGAARPPWAVPEAAPVEEPQAPVEEPPAAPAEPAPEEQAPPPGGANPTPDPFKPIQ
jgi:hypothetical protein